MISFNSILNTTISNYQNNPGFSYSSSENTTSIRGYTWNRLLLDLQYTKAGVQTYHHFVFQENGKPLFSTGLELQIIDHLTGEILFEFFGFNNPKIRSVVTELINTRKPVDIFYNDHHPKNPKMLPLKKFGHTSVHQIKSGRWVGEW